MDICLNFNFSISSSLYLLHKATEKSVKLLETHKMKDNCPNKQEKASNKHLNGRHALSPLSAFSLKE